MQVDKNKSCLILDESPFGGNAKLINQIPVALINSLYFLKCGVDVSRWFGSCQSISLFECGLTGYKWWFPGDVAGDEEFYRLLSRNWDNYYREERWEYEYAKSFVQANMSCLEVGCGRGFFIRSIEKSCGHCIGLEFNQQAIDEKVCESPILKNSIQYYSSKIGWGVDVVFAFQVLEHIADPMGFCALCYRV